MKEVKEEFWDIGKEKPKYSAFFVSEDEKYAILYYDIIEYGIMKFVASAEIWVDKENPKLLLQITKKIFEFQFNRSCYYYPKSNLLVLLTHCPEQNSFSLDYCIINLKKAVFAKYPGFNYELFELDNNKFRIDSNPRYHYSEEQKHQVTKLNGTILDASTFNWCSLDKFESYCSL